MLCDDGDMFDETLWYGVIDDKVFKDENDPQVERLYNTSPPLLQQVPSYEMESVFASQFTDDPSEVSLLEKLEQDYRSRLADRIKVDRPDVSRPLDLAENEPMSQIGPSLASPLYSEEGPVDGRYIYYTPIFFHARMHGMPSLA